MTSPQTERSFGFFDFVPKQVGYSSLDQCRKDALDSLTSKDANKLLVHIKEYNKQGCKMLARGLDIKFCPPEETYNGFYSSRAKQVVLCCDKFSGKEALRSTLTHELVHVYDFCRYRQMWYCKARACSEVRAYNIAKSCTSNEEIRARGGKTREECLRNAAFASSVTACTTSAKHDINSVFEDCFHDYTPLEHAPRKNEFKPENLPPHERRHSS